MNSKLQAATETHLKNCIKVKRYPCCSATPAHTTLAVAPIKVPFPVNMAPIQYDNMKRIID